MARFAALCAAWALAAFPASGRAAQIGREFDVRHYGAVGDGTTLCTAAIERAIDACAAAGGGSVYFPPGQYLTGTVRIRANVRLWLEAGATILGSRNLADYDPPCLIYARGAENVAITGRGEINGQGDAFWKGKQRPYERPERMITFEDCVNVRVQGVTLANSPNWTLNLSRCRRVFIQDVTIVSPREAPNTDGIDPCSCTDVFITRCRIDTGDDAICLKSHDKDRPCENVVVTDCILGSDDSALKLGTASYGAIRRCRFSNIVIRDSKYGVGLFMKDGGSFEDIQFSHIDVETLRLAPSEADRRSIFPLLVDIERRDKQSPLGVIRNVAFRDIAIDTQNGNCLIQGDPLRPLEDVTLDGVQMRVLSRTAFAGRSKPRGNRLLTEKSPNDYADKPAHFTFANIEGLAVRDLFIRDDSPASPYERHLVWGANLSRVTISGLRNRTRSPNRELADVLLRDCRGVLISGCQPDRSRSPFLRLEGGETRRVSVIDNDLSACRAAWDLEHAGFKSELYASGNRPPGR